MRKKNWLQTCVVSAMAFTMLLWFFTAVGKFYSDQGNEGKQHLEDALRRGAVACYAAEGFYPPTLEYLCQHYGIQIDDTQYLVFYEIFAENLMPEITVIGKSYE